MKKKILKATLFLSFLFLVSASSIFASAREIKIIAAASSSFQKNPEWQKEIRDRILFVNQIFEKSFGIHFSVDRYVKWEPQDEKRETDLLLEELRSQITLGLDEIAIGFHKMSQPFNENVMDDLDTIGSAEFFRGFIILRDPFQDLTTLQRQVTTAHEMAHLFGAIHVSGANEIMSPAIAHEPLMVLDPDNEAILQITQRVDFQAGVNSLAAAEIDQLIQIYEKLIRKNPHSDFYYQLGSFYQMRGLQARAVSIWEEAVRYEYSNPLIHWALGRDYYQNSRFDAAIKELGTAVAFFILPSQKKERAMALNFLGVAYYKKGNLDQALFNWLKGLSSDPDNLELQGNLAAAYMSNGDIERGISELLKISVKYPDDQTTLSNLGVAYLKKKDYEKAAQYVNLALEKMAYTQEQEALAVKTKPNTEAKKKTEGMPAEDRLMGDIPESLLRLNLGAAYMGMGDFGKALPQLEAAKKLNPESVEVIQNLAYVYIKNKDYEAAIREAEAGIQLQKENANLYTFLAEGYAMTGKKQEALLAAKSGLLYAPAPLRASLHKNRAVLYAQEGNFPQALIELKDSLNDNWNDADTHLKLGYIYAQMKRSEEAKRSFENALRIDPNQAEAKKALGNIFPRK